MNGREREKHHKCTNVGKVKQRKIMMATVCHITSDSELRKFQPAWFLLHRVYMKAQAEVLKFILVKLQCH